MRVEVSKLSLLALLQSTMSLISQTLLQNRYFIPVGNYFLSRFFNRDYPSGTNVNVFFVPAAIQPGQMSFFTNKKKSDS